MEERGQKEGAKSKRKEEGGQDEGEEVQRYQQVLQSLLTPKQTTTSHCILCEKERGQEERDAVISYTLPPSIISEELRKKALPEDGGDGNFTAFTGLCSSCEDILRQYVPSYLICYRMFATHYTLHYTLHANHNSTCSRATCRDAEAFKAQLFDPLIKDVTQRITVTDKRVYRCLLATLWKGLAVSPLPLQYPRLRDWLAQLRPILLSRDSPITTTPTTPTTSSTTTFDPRDLIRIYAVVPTRESLREATHRVAEMVGVGEEEGERKELQHNLLEDYSFNGGGFTSFEEPIPFDLARLWCHLGPLHLCCFVSDHCAELPIAELMLPEGVEVVPEAPDRRLPFLFIIPSDDKRRKPVILTETIIKLTLASQQQPHHHHGPNCKHHHDHHNEEEHSHTHTEGHHHHGPGCTHQHK